VNALGFKKAGAKAKPGAQPNLRGWKNRRSWADQDNPDLAGEDDSVPYTDAFDISHSQVTVFAYKITDYFNFFCRFRRGDGRG
jgi:hypothetical protein